MIKGRRKKRTKKVHPKNLLPLESWVNLIFAPYLNLDQLVAVRRSCKTFCFHPRVEALIEKKIQECFGKIPRKFWNCFAKDIRLSSDDESFQKRFAIYVRWMLSSNECVVFSTKERLINTYRHQISFSITFVNLHEFEFLDGCVRKETSEPFISIYGLNDVIITETKQKLNDILEQSGGMNDMFELVDEKAFYNLGWESIEISVSPPFNKERLLRALQMARQPGFPIYYHFVNENTVLYVAIF
jgi:hypothetical protein